MRQAKLTAKKIPENEPLTDDDKAWAEEKVSILKVALINAKQKLMDFDSDYEAQAQQHEQELSAVTKTWKGKKGEL